MNSKTKINSVLESAGWFASGVAIIVLPSIWLLFFFLSTRVIAGNPATLWYTTIWLLLASTWLLFWRKAAAEKRLIVEITVWLASVALFIAAACK